MVASDVKETTAQSILAALNAIPGFDSADAAYIRDAYPHITFSTLTVGTGGASGTQALASDTDRYRVFMVWNPTASNNVWWSLDSSITTTGVPLLRNQSSPLIPATSAVYLYQTSGGDLTLGRLAI